MSETAQGVATSVAASPIKGFVAKCWQYVLENPLKSATAATLFLGGLLLLMFFLHIGFMPDVNLESVSSLLYAMALFGIFIAAFSAITMVLPGLALAEFKKSVKFVRPRHLALIMSGTTLTWAVVLFHLIDYLPGWVAWFTWGIAVVMVSPTCLAMDARKRVVSSPLTVSADGKCRSHGHRLSFYSRRHVKLKARWTEHDWSDARISRTVLWLRLRRRWQTYLWASAMVLLITPLVALPLSFIGVIGLAGDIRTAPALQFTPLLTALVAVIAVAAAVIGSVQSTEAPKVAALFAPLLLFLVITATGSFSAFSIIAVKTLGQGEINAARATITGKTCKEINQTLGQRVCANVRDDEIAAICPVMIRSRIGSQVLLEFAPMAVESDKSIQHAIWITSNESIVGQDGKRRTKQLIRRVVIDKAKLLSWRPLDAFGEGKSERPIDALTPFVATSFIYAKQAEITNPMANDRALAKILQDQCGGDLDQHNDSPSSNSAQPSDAGQSDTQKP